MQSKTEVEETITHYLNLLKKNMKSHEDDMLKEMGLIFTKDVYELAPKDTETLAESGMDMDEWLFQKTLLGMDLYILYSGLDNPNSWWEFSDDGLTNHPPDRDYAVFQETGKDEIAKPKYAKHKYFIRTTTRRSDTRHKINTVATQYLNRLMELE